MENRVLSEINNANSILLLTHVDPDGDAIGSILAFYHYLTSINKTVDMVALKIPHVFNFLPGVNNVVENVTKDYDLGIVLDCADKKRIGANEDILSKCKHTICIDHHASNNNYCDLNIIHGNVSSCCQVIYFLFKKWSVELNTQILECLMSGVLTDTNGFSISSVDKDSYIMAADVMDFGVDIHKLFNELLFKKSLARYNLMKIGMDRLEFLCDGKIAFTYILKSDFEDVGAVIGDHEGIVDIGRSIDGVMVSVFLREDDGFTISLRSTGSVDVSKIAAKVGGGGHYMASGAKYNGSLEETKETIICEIKKALSLQ